MQSAMNLTTFAYTFVQQGVYVFGNNANLLMQTLVRVMPYGQTVECAPCLCFHPSALMPLCLFSFLLLVFWLYC